MTARHRAFPCCVSIHMTAFMYARQSIIKMVTVWHHTTPDCLSTVIMWTGRFKFVKFYFFLSFLWDGNHCLVWSCPRGSGGHLNLALHSLSRYYLLPVAKRVRLSLCSMYVQTLAHQPTPISNFPNQTWTFYFCDKV